MTIILLALSEKDEETYTIIHACQLRQTIHDAASFAAAPPPLLPPPPPRMALACAMALLRRLHTLRMHALQPMRTTA